MSPSSYSCLPVLVLNNQTEEKIPAGLNQRFLNKKVYVSLNKFENTKIQNNKIVGEVFFKNIYFISNKF